MAITNLIKGSEVKLSDVEISDIISHAVIFNSNRFYKNALLEAKEEGKVFTVDLNSLEEFGDIFDIINEALLVNAGVAFERYPLKNDLTKMSVKELLQFFTRERRHFKEMKASKSCVSLEDNTVYSQETENCFSDEDSSVVFDYDEVYADTDNNDPSSDEDDSNEGDFYSGFAKGFSYEPEDSDGDDSDDYDEYDEDDSDSNEYNKYEADEEGYYDSIRKSIRKRIDHNRFKTLMSLYTRKSISKNKFAMEMGCSIHTLNKFISVFEYFGEIPTDSEE